MSNKDKDDIIKKWDKSGLLKGLDPKIQDIWESQQRTIVGNVPVCNTPTQSTTDGSFPSLLPMTQRVFAKTIDTNLASVKPMGGLSKMGVEKLRKLETTIEAENRENKIDSIIENSEYKPIYIEEDGRYKEILVNHSYGIPSGKLFYLDFKHGEDEEE